MVLIVLKLVQECFQKAWIVYYIENEELVIDVHVIKKYGTAAILWSFYRRKEFPYSMQQYVAI